MKNVIIPLVLLLGIISNSCTKDFDKINTNPLGLLNTNLVASDYPLIAKGVIYGCNYVSSGTNPRSTIAWPNAFQLIQSLHSDVYANYFATTAANFNNDMFVLTGRWLNTTYTYNYYEVAPNLKLVLDFTAENELPVENAMMKVIKVYFYHRLTDMWGPIPYSEFGKSKTGPIYFDSQEDIYHDFFKILDEAVAVLKSNTGTTQYFGQPAHDVIFQGSVDKWLLFANTLRLRLALRVKYADMVLAKTEAEKAVADGVMENNEHNALIKSDHPNFANPYNYITSWGEFRMSADMESILKGYEDPRVADYFSPADIPDPTDDPVGVTFDYEGMRNGQTKSAKQGTSFVSIASNMAEEYVGESKIGPDWPLVKASEAYFLRAEGALESWDMGDTPHNLYDNGIAVSFDEYGYDGNDLSGIDYITSEKVPAALDAFTPAVSTVPVKFDVTGSKERQLEQIITQKWIALYPIGQEAYSERRRTGYPVLYDRLNSINPDIAIDEIPRRMPFVSSEYDLNPVGVEHALNLLEGPDNGATKLWWDNK